VEITNIKGTMGEKFTKCKEENRRRGTCRPSNGSAGELKSTGEETEGVSRLGRPEDRPIRCEERRGASTDGKTLCEERS